MFPSCVVELVFKMGVIPLAFSGMENVNVSTGYSGAPRVAESKATPEGIPRESDCHDTFENFISDGALVTDTFEDEVDGLPRSIASDTVPELPETDVR